jgi:hypothetical protein
VQGSSIAQPRRLLAPLALAAIVVGASCKDAPKSGANCANAATLVCADEKTALYCMSGTYAPIACHGPRGCAGDPPNTSCDTQLAEEAEACIGVVESYACSVDHKKGLVCRDGRWALWRTCKGPDGCTWKGKSNVECDATAADASDPCGVAGSVACSSDKKSLLICRNDKFETYKACRGPNGCVIKKGGGAPSAGARAADCDNSVGQEGDACDVMDDKICAVDRKSQLICRGSKYVKDKDCHREGGCLFVSHQVPPKCDY